jgi:hypothetical protein
MGDAGKQVPYVKKFNDLLQMIYQYYDASTIRTGALRTIEVSQVRYTWNQKSVD